MYNAVQSSDSADRLIQYIEKDGRCEFVSGIGCSAQTARQDFADTRRRFGQEGLKIQAYAEVVSASAAEFDPADPEAVYKFHLWSKEDAARKYPGRQVLVGSQIDGKTGLCHSHYAVCSPAHEAAEFTHMVKGRPVTEKVVAGRAMTSAGANIFRLRAATNTLLADEQVMESIGYDNARLGELMKDQAGWEGTEKFDPQVGLVGQHAYDNTELVRVTRSSNQWLVELKDRIREAAAQATDEDEFKELLETDGAVRLNVRGEKTKVYSYTFADPSSGKTYTARAGSKRLNGDEFSREIVLAQVTKNQEKQKAAGQQTPAAAPASAGPVSSAPAPDTEQPEKSLEEMLDEFRAEQEALRIETNKARAELGLAPIEWESDLRELGKQTPKNRVKIDELIKFEEKHRDAIVSSELIPDSEVPDGMTRRFLDAPAIADRLDPAVHQRLSQRADMRAVSDSLFRQGRDLKTRYQENPTGETLLGLTAANLHWEQTKVAIKVGDYREVPPPDRLDVAIAAVTASHEKRFAGAMADSVEDQQSAISIRRVGEIRRMPEQDRAEALQRLVVDLHDEDFGHAEIEARRAVREKVSSAPAPGARPASPPATAGQQQRPESSAPAPVSVGEQMNTEKPKTELQQRLEAARAEQKKENQKIKERNQQQSKDQGYVPEM